jgi:hypothetical protein
MVVIDTKKEGLEMVYSEWEVPLYRKLLGEDIEMNSRIAWEFLQDELEPQTISRASVINSLNDNVDEGILGFRRKSGKGGYHRIYKRKMTIKQFYKYLYNEAKKAIKPYI